MPIRWRSEWEKKSAAEAREFLLGIANKNSFKELTEREQDFLLFINERHTAWVMAQKLTGR